MAPRPASPPTADPAPAAVSQTCNCHVLRQAARRATAFYDAAMAPHGLRISQYAVLSRLGRAGPLGVQALAAALGLDRTTLGRNLRPLERDGLVASEAAPGDRRVRRLALTTKGQTVLHAAGPAWHAAQAGFEAAYGRAESQALRDALRRVTTVIVMPEA